MSHCNMAFLTGKDDRGKGTALHFIRVALRRKLPFTGWSGVEHFKEMGGGKIKMFSFAHLLFSQSVQSLAQMMLLI